MTEKREELDVNILIQDLINSVDTQDPAQVRIVINIIKKYRGIVHCHKEIKNTLLITLITQS